MCKKHFIRYFFWTIIVFFVGGAIYSCKESKIDLEEVSIVDLQIHRFYLSSKKNPDLENAKFDDAGKLVDATGKPVNTKLQGGSLADIIMQLQGGNSK